VHQRLIPWENLIDKVVFRGVPSGSNVGDREGAEFWGNTSMTPEEACSYIPRCILVLHVQSQPGAAKNSSSRMDVGLTLEIIKAWRLRMVNGVDLFSFSLKRNILLRFKIMFSVEGNDVASGLKWMLYSNSVVLMQPPTRVSYALENLLVPWVHYVPIENINFTDVEEKVDWILSHDEEAHAIAERSTQFIRDLLIPEEMRLIDDKIAQRYITALWSSAVNKFKSQH
jgi:hypothetical protein